MSLFKPKVPLQIDCCNVNPEEVKVGDTLKIYCDFYVVCSIQINDGKYYHRVCSRRIYKKNCIIHKYDTTVWELFNKSNREKTCIVEMLEDLK